MSETDGCCPTALALQGSSCQSETHNFNTNKLTLASGLAMPSRQPQSVCCGALECIMVRAA